MDRFLIKGGKALRGSVNISGAKNAALPILAATLLIPEPVVISNVPHLRDITTMMNLLGEMNTRLTVGEEMAIRVDTSGINIFKAPYELVKTMRASILVLGPLLGRYGKASVSLPGGCAIGARPVDLHLSGLRALGAEISLENGFIEAKAPYGLKGCEIHLEKVTVTGTENLMMAAVLAQGETVLYNAACEPEVEDLGNFLNCMGANIAGLGTSQIIIQGVEELRGVQYRVMSDRLEAATYLVAGAITRGQVSVHNIAPKFLSIVLEKLRMAGADLVLGEDFISLDMHHKQPQAVDIVTGPYPNFPTDMQAQFMALNVLAEGSAVITETIFENRFMHAQEMIRLGADIKLKENCAICSGKEKLMGAPVMSTDLRGAAGLVLAALMAEGESCVDRVYHIDRGYAWIEEVLIQLGADIQRVSH